MYFSQNKLGRSGGPQYWLNELEPSHQEHLARKRACPVVLMTRYGEIATQFEAVHRNYKRDQRTGKLIKANAQHDRLQRGSSPHSIWKELCHWFGFPDEKVIEKVHADIELDGGGRFVLIPYKFTFRERKHPIEFKKPTSPLTVGVSGVSALWNEQLGFTLKKDAELFKWVLGEISRVVEDNRRHAGISESDILRTAGALRRLGLSLSAYRTQGLDCPGSGFQFLGLPTYQCDVEIKHRASKLSYQIERHAPLGRLVVLCIDDDLTNPPVGVDVIALSSLESVMKTIRQ
jgi:hypothetical protein